MSQATGVPWEVLIEYPREWRDELVAQHNRKLERKRREADADARLRSMLRGR